MCVQVLFPLLADMSVAPVAGTPSTLPSSAGDASSVTSDALIDLEEQRIALITTLTRTFKKHVSTLAELPDFHTLWLKLVRLPGALRAPVFVVATDDCVCAPCRCHHWPRS